MEYRTNALGQLVYRDPKTGRWVPVKATGAEEATEPVAEEVSEVEVHETSTRRKKSSDESAVEALENEGGITEE